MTQRSRSIREAFSSLVGCCQSLDPPIDVEFNPGTTVDKIHEAERRLELKVPPQLSELLVIADGQKCEKNDGAYFDMLLPEIKLGSTDEDFYSDFAYLCGVDEIVENTSHMREINEIVRSDGFEIDTAEDTYETFGPVAVHDSLLVVSSKGNPAMICLDLDPPVGGAYGQVVAVNEQPYAVGVLAKD